MQEHLVFVDPLPHAAIYDSQLPNESSLDIIRVHERISGDEILKKIIDLAKIGGQELTPTPELPSRWSPTRIALSETDLQARYEFILPLMEKAGLDIIDHPVGILGIRQGTDTTLAPLLILSHTDTVPGADMFDGTTGVLGGIAIMQVLEDLQIQTKRTIIVASLTGEESSGYGMALFGSRALFHGLTHHELQAHKPGGETIFQALGKANLDISAVTTPFFGNKFPFPDYAVELHVDQSGQLEKEGLELGVVEAIAAPERYILSIGDSPIPLDTSTYKNSFIMDIMVRGKADHSGATPMNQECRADGLVLLTDVLKVIISNEQLKNYATAIHFGDVSIDNEAINKIPGITHAKIRLSGKNLHDIFQTHREIAELIALLNNTYNNRTSPFDEDPISYTVREPLDDDHFYDPEIMIERVEDACLTVSLVNAVATTPRTFPIVGTIGTWTLDQGIIRLGLDLRSIDLQSRQNAMHELTSFLSKSPNIKISEQLPGSGEPTKLNPYLVDVAIQIIKQYNLGEVKSTNSAAGHDAQNAARAGVPTTMLFIPSKNGIAHHPDAYTSPQHIEKGVKALAALILKLSL